MSSGRSDSSDSTSGAGSLSGSSGKLVEKRSSIPVGHLALFFYYSSVLSVTFEIIHLRSRINRQLWEEESGCTKFAV